MQSNSIHVNGMVGGKEIQYNNVIYGKNICLRYTDGNNLILVNKIKSNYFLITGDKKECIVHCKGSLFVSNNDIYSNDKSVPGSGVILFAFCYANVHGHENKKNGTMMIIVN